VLLLLLVSIVVLMWLVGGLGGRQAGGGIQGEPFAVLCSPSGVWPRFSSNARTR
jgi:hypothetical protein